MNFTLTAEDIGAQEYKLAGFHENFKYFFRTSTRSVAPQALEYLKGQLLLGSRRNMARMTVEVTQENEQSLSHFISTSPWDDRPLIEAIGMEAVELLGSGGSPGLILDECGIPKQGKKSVGVARQYCGSLGKVDNSQVGVFLSYSTGKGVTLIDRHLYIPQEWINDKQRCERAGIPIEFQQFKSKAQLGLEMILGAKERGTPFTFVGMDAHYGEQPWLLSCLEGEGIVYVADIPSTTRVYLEYPTIGIPDRKGTRGRPPQKERVLEGEPVEVKGLLSSDRISWCILKVRDTQRGELWVKVSALRVWRIEDELPCPQAVWLIIRQELDGSDTKFSLSNANDSTPLKILAEWQSRRYFVERAFEDAKGLAGLDEYQVIGWRGWHHHTAMVLLAMLFLIYLKQGISPHAPMLTLQDAVDILKIVMPQKTLSLEEARCLIYQKHLNRFLSRNCRLEKQRIWLQESGFL